MTLKERLNADFKEAMKNKEKVRKDTISFVRAAIKQFEVDNREEIDDAGIASILAKQVKMRKDALADFESAGRTEDVYKRQSWKEAGDEWQDEENVRTVGVGRSPGGRKRCLGMGCVDAFLGIRPAHLYRRHRYIGESLDRG